MNWVFDEVRVSADSELLERQRFGMENLLFIHPSLHTSPPIMIVRLLAAANSPLDGKAFGAKGSLCLIVPFMAFEITCFANGSCYGSARVSGLFKTPEEMPRSNAGNEYTEFIDSEMNPVLEDMRNFNLNIFD